MRSYHNLCRMDTNSLKYRAAFAVLYPYNIRSLIKEILDYDTSKYPYELLEYQYDIFLNIFSSTYTNIEIDNSLLQLYPLPIYDTDIDCYTACRDVINQVCLVNAEKKNKLESYRKHQDQLKKLVKTIKVTKLLKYEANLFSTLCSFVSIKINCTTTRHTKNCRVLNYTLMLRIIDALKYHYPNKFLISNETNDNGLLVYLIHPLTPYGFSTLLSFC